MRITEPPKFLSSPKLEHTVTVEYDKFYNLRSSETKFEYTSPKFVDPQGDQIDVKVMVLPQKDWIKAKWDQERQQVSLTV